LYAICNLSIVPLRAEPSDKSEMISQVLFGDTFIILEKTKHWSRIKLSFDDYEGYIDNKQYEIISESFFQNLSVEKPIYSGEVIDFISDDKNSFSMIPLGSRLPFFLKNEFQFNSKFFKYEGNVFSGKLPKREIIQKAFIFLNTPFFMGRKNSFWCRLLWIHTNGL
jgi:hypothetical protein